ncbi:hypothetical protein GCM10009554_02810 [Kribbella koreensis]|uniref:Uncharacterized protein n=1 Tax=Kribbella koreensis TaxID=57909 RepID=A0ABP3ZNR2_9ACTN
MPSPPKPARPPTSQTNEPTGPPPLSPQIPSHHPNPHHQPPTANPSPRQHPDHPPPGCCLPHDCPNADVAESTATAGARRGARPLDLSQAYKLSDSSQEAQAGATPPAEDEHV